MNASTRRAASKLAALLLSAALLVPHPAFAVELATLPEAGVQLGALTTMAPVAPLGPVVLGSQLLINPAVSAGVALQSAEAFRPISEEQMKALSQSAVERHPVIGTVSELQRQGVTFPSRASARLEGEQLKSAAESLPVGSPLRAKVSAMAESAMSAANGGSGAGFNAAYDGQNVGAKSFWEKLAGIPGVPGFVKRKAAEKAAQRKQPIPLESRELAAAQVRWTAPIEQLPGSTREHPESTGRIVGQDGALENIRFGLAMKEDPSKKGSQFNLYVSGPAGSGRETAVKSIVEPMAKAMETPTDLVAATNFGDPENPAILELAPGKAPEFQGAVDEFIEGFGMAVLQAQHAPEIAKAKKKIEGGRDKAIEKLQADLDAMIEEIRLEVPSQRNEWGVKAVVLQGKLIALPTRRAKGTQDAFAPFGSKEEVEAAIKSGLMTKEEFDAAIKAAKAEGAKLKDDFQKVETQKMMEGVKAKMQLEMLDRQAAIMAAQELAPAILSTVAEDRHSTPEHEAWQETAKKRVGAFMEEVGKQVVNGKWGFIITEDTISDPNMPMGLTQLVGGKMEPISDIKAVGMTEQDIQDIIAAAKPFIEQLRGIVEKINAEHDKLHEKDPPYEAKAIEYVQHLLSFAASNYQVFLPHEDEKGGKAHFEPNELIRISVLQSSEPGSGAPVVWENNPTYARLFGSAEDSKKRMAIDGIGQVAKIPGGPEFEAGSYIKARGGFLILDVMQVLRQPGSWPALMQAVRNGEAEVAEEGLMGLFSNGDKYHVPGKTKIVFIGSPYIKMLLEHYDEDFAAGFQAPVAEFQRRLEINGETIDGYLDFIKNVIAKAKGLIREFERDGIAALLEASARDMDSNKKLSAQFGLSDVRMRKASQAAADRLAKDPNGPKGVTRADVEKVRELDLQSDQLHAKSYQEILRDNIFILDTQGPGIVGQINGLAVMGAFGAPMRKTFVAAPGKNGIEIVSDDRRADTTGPSYNKAIEVIHGFMNFLFKPKKNWGMQVRISSEQNYGGIDGDSATSTQIYGILSSLSGIGIDPEKAVTGSADQFGHVQAIGGVNEKIEGFYDLCKMRGLTGTQGVMIPKANVGDLMLKPEIVQAIRDGKFHIWAIGTVQEGVEIMFKKPDGSRPSFDEVYEAAKKGFAKLQK